MSFEIEPELKVELETEFEVVPEAEPKPESEPGGNFLIILNNLKREIFKF